MPTRWRCARVRGLAVPLRNFSAVEAKSEIALPAAEATPADFQAQAAAVAQSARLACLLVAWAPPLASSVVSSA
jgi:hypothetical protein